MSNLPTPGTYVIDPMHSTVGFVVRHVVGAKVRGAFAEFEGTFTVAEPIEDSTVSVTINAASVNTNQPMRDDHLRTNDFFDVPNHPQWKFVSTGIDAKDDGTAHLHGDLTIRGTTLPVTLDVEFHGEGPGMQGGHVAGFSATTEINREDFGVNFNRVLDAGGLAVGKKVTIEIDIEASLQA